MRRALVGLLLLLALAGGAAGVMAAGVYRAHDQVVLEEETLYGDRAAADGVSVRLFSEYDDHLFWDTSCTLEDGQRVHTEYTFSAAPVRQTPPREYSGVYAESTLFVGAFFDVAQPQTGLDLAYQQLYETVAPGEEKSTVIYLKDYISYYPITITLDFPGTQYDGSRGRESGERDQSDAGRAAAAIADYFQVPVLEGEQYEISVERREDGAVSGWGGGSSGSDSYNLWFQTTLTDEACYFTFDAHSQEGAVVDISLIPGGYGIYRLPYEQPAEGEEDGIFCGVDAADLEMVYPLDPQVEILSLSAHPERDQLLLHTREGGQYVLTVIRLSTMDTLQRLELAEFPENTGWNIYDEGDFIVTLLGDRLILTAVTEQGEYTLRFHCPCLPEEIPYLSLYNADWAFDGERLALVQIMQNEEVHFRATCSFDLVIYESSGMVYCGRYQNSLDTGTGFSYSDEYCRGRSYDPLVVSWQD